MQQLKIVRDRNRWTCALPGPGEPVVIADTREKVVEFLERLECVAFHNGVAYLTIRRNGRHARTIPQARRINSHR